MEFRQRRDVGLPYRSNDMHMLMMRQETLESVFKAVSFYRLKNDL